MKILSVLNPTLDDYKISGAALFGINLGEYLNNNYGGVQVDYIASGSIADFVGTEPVLYWPKVRKSRAVSDTIAYAVNVFRENNYDVMHIHLHQMSVLASICKLIPKDIPVVYTQHSSTILGRFSLGYRDSARELSQCNDRKIKIVCPSMSMVDIWEEYIEDSNHPNVVMIRNGIKDVHTGLSNRNDTYISCGRIDPNKGMLEVAKLCVSCNRKVILIGSLGMGSMKISDDAKKYYDDFVYICEKNKDIITWYEYLSNEKIRELMSMSKAYISMSKKESFGLTVAEAMSTGLPVLFYEEDAIAELNDSTTAVMIPKSDLSRKSEPKRLAIYEKYLKLLEMEISEGIITSDNVTRRSLLNGTNMRECAANYMKQYTNLIGLSD